MAKKSKKSKKNLGLFVMSLMFALLFAGLTIGLSVRPYSTLTPYTYKNENTEIKITYGIKNWTIETKTNSSLLKETFDMTDDKIASLKKENAEGKIDAFKRTFAGKEYTNTGNIAVVAICGILASMSIGLSIAFGSKSFR